MFEGNSRITRRSRQSNLSFSSSKPTKYRIIYKSRSGLLNEVQETKSQIINKQKMNATEISFLSSSTKNIQFPRKNSTVSVSCEQIKIPKSNKDQISQRPQYLPRINLPTIEQNPHQQQFQQQNPQVEMRYGSIDDIEKKVDSLIQLKLLRTSEGVNEQTEQVQDIEKIEKQMGEIVQFLQAESPSQNLEETNKKIGILEKIMAQNATQSDIAKKYFYKKINNKKKKIPDLNQYKTDVNAIKQKTKELMRRNAPAAIHCESLCQINYRPPEKQAYPEKKTKLQYIFKHQALPRSTYDRDYLTYGSLPKYNYKEYSTIVPKIKVGKGTSNYQDDYKTKVVEKINYKQLDCFRDKFKNLKIPLIHNSSNITNKTICYDESQSELRAKEQEEKNKSKGLVKGQKMRIKSQPPENSSHFIKLLSSQNHSNFTGENNNLRSQIKHKNLHAMKYAYKATIHA